MCSRLDGRVTMRHSGQRACVAALLGTSLLCAASSRAAGEATSAAAAPRAAPSAASNAAPSAVSNAASSAVSNAVPSAASSAARSAFSVAQVEAAASAVRADPDLGATTKERIWRFKPTDDKRDPPAPAWAGLATLARWLAESGRVIVWLLGAAALSAVVVAARRWFAVHGDTLRGAGARLPSHVRELDIRPESLPADIGATVRELWLAGERRSALSLLYRGALSRLVHDHAVAIGSASTEGDCVRLARAALAQPNGDYVGALVHAWQLAVYGGRALATPQVLALCGDFDRMLPAVPRAAR